MLAGGYHPCSPDDLTVSTVLDFIASKEHLELINVNSCAAQVVAGMNYRFNLDVTKPTGEKAVLDTVVYVSLPPALEMKIMRADYSDIQTEL